MARQSNKKKRDLPVIGGGGLPILVAYIFLIAWGILAWEVRFNAPTGRVSQAVTVTPEDGEAVIGYQELGQRQGPRAAASQHVRIVKRDGAWLFGNISHSRRLFMNPTDGGSFFTQRWRLQQGDRISFNGADLEVTAVDSDAITIRDRGTGRQVTFDGDVNPQGEPVHTVCQNFLRRNLNGVKWMVRGWSSGETPAFSIGGGVNCSDRWKVDALPPAAVEVVWREGSFWLAPGTRRFDVLFGRAGGDPSTSFTDLLVPLTGDYGRINSLIAGQTLYRITAGEESVTFTPLANRDFFYLDEDPPPNFERWEWIGAGNGPWDWIVAQTIFVGAGLLAAAALAVLIFLRWQRRHSHDFWWLVQALAAFVPAAIGIWLTILLARGGGNPDQSMIVGMAWLAWFWATFMLVWTGRMRGFSAWIWPGAIALAGIGVVTLFQLGAGAENTRWIGFYDKHAALLALFAWGMAALTAVPDRFWRDLWLRIFNNEAIVATAAVVLIAAMVVQFLAGGEEGIAGIQPVEFVKTAFVILLGYVGLHVTETREREVRAYRDSPLKFLAPYFRFAAIFFLFIASMVVGVRDFSPMVIMSVVFLAWLWKLGGTAGEVSSTKRIWRWVRPALFVVVLAIVALAVYVYNNPHVVPDGFPQKDRIQVWAEPDLHPHSGSQVLGSLDYVGSGGWFGAREWFGPNGPVMTLPAVQDDFITAFLINRFGGVAGLVMLAIQLTFIAILFLLGRYAQRRLGEGDFRDQNAGVVLGYTLYGLGCLHAAHWLISWGNTLSLLPVMGQPMTWLTAGNSHLMGFALLILVTAMISSWVAESYADEKRGAGRLGP